jgi:protein-S-isoprenylcysteine O-methyltransferase Ste14
VPSQTPQPPLQQPIAGFVTRVGGWLFERRTLIPIPLAAPLLLLRIGEAPPSVALLACGAAVVAAGEIVRLWAVHHIGVISRTRSDRLGPLVATGPFAIVRNPLYLGNVALWVGFAVLARMLWMVPVIVVVLGFEYHAIVRWEEQLLESRLGDDYRAYAAQVPRWLPRSIAAPADASDASHSWRHTFFSERGTLIAIFVASALLWIKARF